MLDFAPLLARLATRTAGRRARAPELFHGALIEGCAAVDRRGRARAAAGRAIALGGGCMMNRILAEGLAGALRDRGLIALAGARSSLQ